MGSKTILIALPCGARDKLPLPPRVPAFSRTLDIKLEVLDDDDESFTMINKGRKRKMESLSTEEKFLRKKMKNRVAAQTSRDKKKARMDELEIELAQARQQIKKLRAENAALRLRDCIECGKKVSSRGSQEFVPAASKPELPLQKGREPRLETHLPAWCAAWALLLLLMACRHHLNTPQSLRALDSPMMTTERTVVKDLRAERMKWWGSHQNTWNPMKLRP